MQSEHSLYKILGLGDFTSSTAVNRKKAQLDSVRATAGDESDEAKSQALEILGNPKSKVAYDLLLGARKRPDKKLPKIIDSELQAEVNRVAAMLGIEFNPRNPNQLRFVGPILGKEDSSNPNQQLSFQIGKQKIRAVACPFECVPSLPSENAVRIIRYFTPHGSIERLRSGREAIVHHQTNVGDIGLVIVVGLGDGLPSLEAAIFNQTVGIYGPLQHAGKKLFSNSSRIVAETFGIRNAPARIRQIQTDYYRSLGSLMPTFVPQVSANQSIKVFQDFAKNSF